MADNCIVYGERPITELFALYADSHQWKDVIRNVELLDGTRIVSSTEDCLENVYVEAPLGKLYGYVDLIVVTSESCLLIEVKPDSCLNVVRRLGEQLPRYYCAMMRKDKSRPRPDITARIQEAMLARRSYLVSVTADVSFPESLKQVYGQIRGVNAGSVGWMSYSLIVASLSGQGYRLSGKAPHIWAESQLQNATAAR